MLRVNVPFTRDVGPMGKKPHKASKSKVLSWSVVKDSAAVSACSASGKPKVNATTFRKGRKKTGGRRAGTPNRNTQVLREAVLLAAAAAGSEKGRNGLFLYLKKVAKKQPAIFMPVLGRLLPLQVESQQTSKTEVTYRSFAEIRRELIKRGVPVDTIYPALADATDETDKTDDKPDNKPDKTDDDPGEQQR
jgi:hypothetical protein